MCGTPSWRNGCFAQQPARRTRDRLLIGVERVNGLIGRAKQVFQAEFARAAAEAAGMGQAQQLEPGVVHQLQRVFAVKGKQGRVHHFQDAGQQGGGLKGAHALFLQQVGECVHLRGQLAERVMGAGSAGAEGVVALAQRRDHVGERLQRPDQALNQSGGRQHQIQEQAGDQQQRWRQTDGTPIENKGGQDQRGQRQEQAMEPRPADSRAPTPALLLVRFHFRQIPYLSNSVFVRFRISQCGGRARRG